MSSAAGVSASSGGAGSDCEGEDQEDPSSSIDGPLEPDTGGEDVAPPDVESQEPDALNAFRQQWQRDLVSSPQRQLASPRRQVQQNVVDAQAEQEQDKTVDNEEEKAKQLFLRGTELEQCGSLYEAIRYYKRAVQLVPDVEFRLYASTKRKARSDSPTDQDSSDTEHQSSDQSSNSESEDITEEDLLAKVQRVVARNGRLCEPAFPVKSTHLSSLPYELVLLVLRWVVSLELDAASLERTGAVCRGLFLASRDPEIWRMLCARTWGLNCGTLKGSGYVTWRQMYIERPRLRLHGCYISKTTYLRHGENSFQDQFYRPWYLIEYYRYLRFFPEGVVLMLTTAEEPASCVSLLKQRSTRNPNVLAGHYRLTGDKVILVVKKQPSEKKPAHSSTRFRSRRKEATPDLVQGQTFHLELQLRTLRSRLNWQLVWRGYKVAVRRNGADVWQSFDIPPSKYPPFYFSRVRSYHAEADCPLS